MTSIGCILEVGGRYTATVFLKRSRTTDDESDRAAARARSVLLNGRRNTERKNRVTLGIVAIRSTDELCQDRDCRACCSCAGIPDETMVPRSSRSVTYISKDNFVTLNTIHTICIIPTKPDHTCWFCGYNTDCMNCIQSNEVVVPISPSLVYIRHRPQITEDAPSSFSVACAVYLL